MGKTLFEVVPRCLTDHFKAVLANQSPTFKPDAAKENDGFYLVHFETGKRIYELYAELDQGDDNNPDSLAILLRDKYQNSSYLGPWARLWSSRGIASHHARQRGSSSSILARAPPQSSGGTGLCPPVQTGKTRLEFNGNTFSSRISCFQLS
jgi:hypothetical protein